MAVTKASFSLTQYLVFNWWTHHRFMAFIHKRLIFLAFCIKSVGSKIIWIIYNSLFFLCFKMFFQPWSMIITHVEITVFRARPPVFWDNFQRAFLTLFFMWHLFFVDVSKNQTMALWTLCTFHTTCYTFWISTSIVWITML